MYTLKETEKAWDHSEYQLLINLSKPALAGSTDYTHLAITLPLSIKDEAPWYGHNLPPLGVRSQVFYTPH